MTELYKLNKEIEAAFAELDQTGEEHLFEKFEALKLERAEKLTY